jgi:hypothetical protein
MKRIIILAILLCGLTTACYSADLPLAWDASANATGYKLQISTDMGATWGEVRDAGNSITFTWLGAPDTGLVLFRVSAYNTTGEAWGTTKGAWYCGTWVVPPPAVGLGAK